MDWKLVDTIGSQLGVNYRARQKWRQRKIVPHKYRIEMLARSGGRITVDMFAKLDREHRRTTANYGERQSR